MEFKKKDWIYSTAYACVSFLLIFCGVWLSPLQHFFWGAFLVLAGVGLYFAGVFILAQGNWLDIRPVFNGVWFVTIGLASLRLTGYQEEWQAKTWVIVALATFLFQVGAALGIDRGRKWYPFWKQKVSGFKLGRLRFSMKEGRLFWICIITTAIGLTCFVINVLIRGYIPCFTNNPQAYIQFYTRFHVFAVAATGVSGLCYYCIRTQALPFWKKAILWFCILYSTFLFPIMVVSRGVFVVSALALTVSVFYLHKKKFLALVLCLAVILGVYYGCSQLRNYSSEYLNFVFKPIEVDIDDPEDEIEDSGEGGEGFKLSPQMAFLYSYLTVSHDNFNHAVRYVEPDYYTYGARQLMPFNVLLRSDSLELFIEDHPPYFVDPNLNTLNLLGDFYYDFGFVGVVVLLFLWAFLFGLNQGTYEAGEGLFLRLLLGNTMVPVALCFFSSWMSVFTHWMLWGTVLIYALAACVTLAPKKEK